MLENLKFLFSLSNRLFQRNSKNLQLLYLKMLEINYLSIMSPDTLSL